MNKRERIVAAKEGRKPSMLHDSDYLLGVYDETYDVNPIPYGDELSLNVDEEDNRIDIDLAIQTAVRFGIHESDAEKYAKEILEVIKKNWNRLASEYGLSRRQIEEMKPAFSACYE